MTWKDALELYLQNKYGDEYARRVMRHVEWVLDYEEYGAPGHLDYVLIKALVDCFDTAHEILKQMSE